MFPTVSSQAIPLQSEEMRKRPFQRKQSLKKGFPVCLPLQILNPMAVRGARGETTEISGRRIAFTILETLDVGLKLEVGIDWPVLLDGRVPLTLCMSGKVTNCEGQQASMTVETYVFRIRGKRIQKISSDALVSGALAAGIA